MKHLEKKPQPKAEQDMSNQTQIPALEMIENYSEKGKDYSTHTEHTSVFTSSKT